MTIEDLIKKELLKSKSIKHYNGWKSMDYEYGYHSYDLDNINIKGQRNPKKRLDEYRKHIDFSDKIVYDFGCNVGSMLHHLPEIKKGIGYDFDKKCVESANNISKILGYNHMNFINHDFDKNSYEEFIKNLDDKIDISFLLSIIHWIKSWRELFQIVIDRSKYTFIETNRKDLNQEKDLIKFLNKFPNIEYKVILNESNDDIKIKNRKTYLVINNIL